MKIMHVSTLYPPHIVGGAEKSVALLAEEQARAGLEVAAACLTPNYFTNESRNGVQVWRVPHSNLFWMEEADKKSRVEKTFEKIGVAFNYKQADVFSNIFDQFKPDILHTHSLVDINTDIWKLAKRHGVKIVHTLRDYDLLCTNSGMFLHGKPCKRLHKKCRILTFDKYLNHKHIDAVVSVAKYVLDVHVDNGYFGHIPESRRHIIWNPATIDNGSGNGYSRPKNGPIIFGFLGRLTLDKGVGTLIEAANRLPQGAATIKIGGKLTGESEVFVKSSAGLPIEYCGFVDPNQFLGSIDVLVVPSIWAEPLPRTILEAYAMGVPVVGARSGGIPDMIGLKNVDWLFTPGDDVDLANKLLAVLERGRNSFPSREELRSAIPDTSPAKVVGKYDLVYGGL